MLSLLFVLLAAHVAGCSTAVSREHLKALEQAPSAAEIAAAPNQFRGRTVLISGSILEVENRGDESFLQVLVYPNDDRGYADLSEPAIGRLMLVQPKRLDPLVFQRGRKLAAVGTVAGEQTIQAGGIERQIPVVRPEELNLLDEPHFFPPFHLGIGLQFGF